jgi:hypothetical protein
MDPNKINFKSSKHPDFIADNWNFYFQDMRAYNEREDSWYRVKMDVDCVAAQIYPHGFFWMRISNSNEAFRKFQEAYAEFILLSDEE